MATLQAHRVRRPQKKSSQGDRQRKRAKSRIVKTRYPVNRHETLPGWDDLISKNERLSGRDRNTIFDAVPTRRFALIILLIASLFTLYVGHVHATQEVLANVLELRRENLRLHLEYNRLKGEYDRQVGPAIIYQRARRLGLEEGIVYGPTIKKNR